MSGINWFVFMLPAYHHHCEGKQDIFQYFGNICIMPIAIKFMRSHNIRKNVEKQRASQINEYSYRNPKGIVIIDVSNSDISRMIIKKQENVHKE